MGFRDDIQQDTISNLPIRDASAVPSDTPIRQAIQFMRDKSLGCVVIVDQAGVPTGIFTEQSLLDVLTKNVSLDERAVGDFCDSGFLAVGSDQPISRVWDAVERDGLRFICVTDGDGKFVGVTGQRGIAEYLAECFPQEVLVQRLGSTPWMQHREGA